MSRDVSFFYAFFFKNPDPILLLIQSFLYRDRHHFSFAKIVLFLDKFLASLPLFLVCSSFFHFPFHLLILFLCGVVRSATIAEARQKPLYTQQRDTLWESVSRNCSWLTSESILNGELDCHLDRKLSSVAGMQREFE